MPCCCTHTRGGNRTQGAKQKAPLCTRTPTIPPFGEKRPSSGGAHRAGQQANEQQTVPLCARTPTPHLSVGTSELRAAHIGPSKTAPNCAHSNSHAPTFRRGTSELQVSMHSGPKANARTSEGWGDAIDVGVIGCRLHNWRYIHWARLGGGDEPPKSQDVGLGDNISLRRYIYGTCPGCND